MTNPLTAEAPPARRRAADHLVPLPGGRWGLWKHVAVRSAGFPAEGVLRLAAPELARRADELGRAEAVTDDEWRSFRRLFDDEMGALEGRLQEIVRDGRFQAALAWQNHHALKRAVWPLLARTPGTDARNSHHRQREELVTSYWQRYSIKNDTIGFFGPVGWVRLDGAGPTSFHPIDRLLDAGDVFFEFWAIDRVATALAAQEGMAEWLAPRRVGFVRIDGDQVVLPGQPPVAVSTTVAEVFRRCDGIRPAREIARELVDTGLLADGDEIAGILADLRRRRWISWTLGLPLTPRPEADLRRLLERIGDAPLRDRSLGQLDRLERARRKAAEALEDATPLVESLDELDRTFSEITSSAPTRRGGKMYAGRTLLYPDCRRALEFELGAEIVAALAPLDLLLESGRWFTHQVAQVLREELRALHGRLVARHDSPLALSTLWFEALSVLHGTAVAALDRIEAEMRERWARVLRCPLDAPRVRYDASVLRERVEALFDAPDVGWIGAGHCSPDVMIAATDVEAIRRGDFELVLGELHLALIAFGHHCFVTQHPAPEELLTCLDRDIPQPRLLPVLPQEDASRLTIRTHSALVRESDFLVALNSSAADPARPRLLASADLIVEEFDDSLVVRLPSGETRDVLDLFSAIVLRQVIDRFTIFGDDRHTPRVNFDRLVVARETWRFQASELDFAGEIDEAQRFVRARAWQRSRGLPRHVFVTLPSEQKPFYVDFEGPLYVNVLAKGVRRFAAHAGAGDEPRVRIVEMLPSLEKLWLRDAAGRAYTSECRLAAVALR